MLSGSNMVALGDADAKLVVQSLTTFVQVHQALLNVVIGKHGLLTLIPFFEPIRQALVSLEATVDVSTLIIYKHIYQILTLGTVFCFLPHCFDPYSEACCK